MLGCYGGINIFARDGLFWTSCIARIDLKCMTLSVVLEMNLLYLICGWSLIDVSLPVKLFVIYHVCQGLHYAILF